jgi:serine/threonine protein kinase
MMARDTVAEESVMHEGTSFHDDCIQLPTCQTQTDSFSPNQDECDDQNNICNSAAMYPSPFDKKYVTPQDFELLRVIGMGSFGKVLQVRSKHSQQLLAMKIISKRLLNKKLHYIENIHAEREILTKVRHPFVVTMHCSFQTREKLFIVMDFLAGGELFLRIGREGIFRENTARFYIAEIILALEHLHSKGILHRYVFSPQMI